MRICPPVVIKAISLPSGTPSRNALSPARNGLIIELTSELESTRSTMRSGFGPRVSCAPAGTATSHAARRHTAADRFLIRPPGGDEFIPALGSRLWGLEGRLQVFEAEAGRVLVALHAPR